MLIETVAMARLTLWVQPVLLLLAATGAFVAGVVLQLAPSIALSSILFVLTVSTNVQEMVRPASQENVAHSRVFNSSISNTLSRHK